MINNELITVTIVVFLTKAEKIIQDYEEALEQLRDFHKQPTFKLGILSTFKVEINQLIHLSLLFDCFCILKYLFFALRI